jgi:hypothetical protein
MVTYLYSPSDRTSRSKQWFIDEENKALKYIFTQSVRYDYYSFKQKLLEQQFYNILRYIIT